MSDKKTLANESEIEIRESRVDIASKKTSTDETSILIGRRIVEFRKNVGLTQKQLADQLGMTVTTIANWERGRRGLGWVVDTYRLCKALRCELADLVPPEEDNALAREAEALKALSQEELIALYQAEKLRTTLQQNRG